MRTDEAFIKVRGLTKHFPVGGKRLLKAVDQVSFEIKKGQVLGLVGESGCGKTTIGRLILQLVPPTSGEVFFDGVELGRLSTSELRRMRRRMQIVFQDPYSSLDPRMTVGATLTTPMKVQNLYREGRRERAAQLLEQVGLKPTDLDRYPHEFSGGQRQRIALARALSVDPEFVVADEPVSALDVSIQSQVLNLFKDLQERLGLTCLFISHDLSVVQFISDRVAVVYMGRIVEMAPSRELYETHRHPYTRILLAAIPHPDPVIEQNKPPFSFTGEISSPIDPPDGCRFYSRCPERVDRCRTENPELVELKPGHLVSCFKVQA